jgi:hypothetical protein
MNINPEKYYFKAFGLNIQSPIPVRGLLPTVATEEIDINIIFEKIEVFPTLHETKVQRKGLNATFGMFDNNTNDAYMVWEKEISFRLIYGKTMIVDTNLTDLDFQSLFIVSEPLGILLFQRGDILLHASAVRLPNHNGIVFMGEPGMGKSTTTAAFVKAGCNIISDDLVAIRLIDNKPYLIPSFPQIKLWKKSVEGLGFENNEKLTRIIEGTNKFAYYDENGFDDSPALLTKIYTLGADQIGDISEIHYPIELLKYFALPAQLSDKGLSLKRHFEIGKIIAQSITIEGKSKMKSFDDLSDFVNEILLLNAANK